MRWTDTGGGVRTGKPVRGPWIKVLAEARSWRINVMQKIERGTLLPANSVTVGEAIEEFVIDMKSGRAKSKFREPFKPKTVRQYEWSLRAHVLPALGDRRLARIRRRDLLDWVELMEFEHEPSTIHNAASPLSCVFRRALDCELIDANPMAGLPLPPRRMCVAGAQTTKVCCSEASGAGHRSTRPRYAGGPMSGGSSTVSIA